MNEDDKTISQMQKLSISKLFMPGYLVAASVELQRSRELIAVLKRFCDTVECPDYVHCAWEEFEK